MDEYWSETGGDRFYPDEPDLLVPTGPCRCDRKYWHHSDTAGRNANGELLRQACCERCYNHWWTDEYLRPVPHQQPFRPYTFVLAAMGLIAPPPNHVAVPTDLKGLTRFNYWHCRWINPRILAKHTFPGDHEWPCALERIDHDYSSAAYEAKHRAGDKAAIFEFVASDPLALEAAWVAKQLSDWRRENSDESIRNYRRLTGDAIDNRGRGTQRLSELRREIDRDQAIVRELFRAKATRKRLLPLRVKLGLDADPGPLTERAVRDLYDEYRRYQREWRTHEPNGTEDQFFAELATMAARLPAT